MGFGIYRAIVLGLLTSGAVLWPSLAMAQPRILSRPVVPASSSVRTVGEVDPAEPIEIVVTNSTTVPLGVGFAGGANLEIAPGDEAKLTFAAAPVNLFIYPLAQETSLRNRVAIEDNTISAEVQSITSVAPGDASLNVDGAGTVYIY
ncbi:hypothetical protein C7293_06755 [filamentous cyanobacterium CCT1]|nr:hypothetical protein C7293_06755 [filamentous cyanobacterium CCT1]PSN77302.1 hypothetical protein C8B47_22780 [filamentous cyanobacterium CCP4]